MSSLRRTGLLLSKCSLEGANFSSPFLQLVRGIKPRWLPKSKSKIFYVREPTPINEEEAEDLRLMYYHYRTKVRAVRAFLTKQQIQKVSVLREQSAAENRDIAAEFQSMENAVRQWNSQVETLRVESWAKEKERHEERSRKWMERDQHRQVQRRQKAEEKLLQNLEDSKSFITMDNLDTEIEKLLNVRQDYNFAIDKQGNRISDSELLPKTDNGQLAEIPGHKDSMKN